jgi:2-keto-3-deoxy-L-rhamnonate aldolase RhmA
VIAQIEDPEAVEAVEEIAATPGIDALFLGPADLTVGYGHDTQDNADLARAYARTGEAARAAGRAFMTFVPMRKRAEDACGLWRERLLHRLRAHAWMLQGARRDVAGIREIG